MDRLESAPSYASLARGGIGLWLRTCPSRLINGLLLLHAALTRHIQTRLGKVQRGGAIASAAGRKANSSDTVPVIASELQRHVIYLTVHVQKIPEELTTHSDWVAKA